MLDRRWSITACDISPEMIERAIRKFPEGVAFDVCDMRELPDYGAFQLVWALNDAVNYLLGDDDLQIALSAMGRNLSEDGLVVFDANTRRQFGEYFEGEVEEMGGERWTWRGLGSDGDIYEVELSGEGVESHHHRERYRSVPEVQAAMVAVGLTPLAAMGQSEANGPLVMAPDWDEDRDQKIVHVAGRR